MGVQLKVVSVNRKHGIGQKSGKAYDFNVVGCLMSTLQGDQYVEINTEGDTIPPELGKVYAPQVEWYADRDRRLTFRVMGLVLVPPAQVGK